MTASTGPARQPGSGPGPGARDAAGGRLRVGWWFALEPVGADAVAWSLIRVDDLPPDGPVGAGLLTGVRQLRTFAASMLPIDPPDRTASPPQESAGSGGLWTGPLTDYEAERWAAVRLGQGLLPDVLRDELLAADLSAVRHTVTVACRGWLAQVPWEVLALDMVGDVRLVERARVAAGLSPTVNAGRRRAPQQRPGAPALLVLDPGPRGQDGFRGSLGEHKPLYPGGIPLDWDEALDHDDQIVPDRGTLGADRLGELLRSQVGWSRLLYFGHCLPGSADTPAGAALLLSTPNGEERFTAHAWLGDPQRWPCPARVALIACGSDDAVQLEQSGLPVAAVNAGAELLTVTRWTLPVGTERSRHEAVTALALAVDAAHREEDALTAIGRWQCERLAAWRAGGAIIDSPLLWGALATYLVPPARLEPAP